MASIKPLTVQEKKDLEKFTKFLALKAAQIIVQSRLGKKISTQGKSCTTSSDWFNLAIMDLPDVLAETKRAIRSELGGTPQLPLCVEISLRTSDGDTMVLETWCLSSLNEPNDGSTTVIATYTIYNRMGILLRSLLAITRTTPAYRLSRRQSPDSYVICYRIYQGEPQFHNLGDGYEQTRVGQIVTPVGTLHFSVTYRTKMTISPTQIGNSNNSIMLKSDHFQNDNSAEVRSDDENYVVIMNKPLKRGTYFVKPEEHYMTPPETPKPFEKLFDKQVCPPQSTVTSTDISLPKTVPKTFSFNLPPKKKESVEELRPLKIAFANGDLDEGPKVANLYWYFKEAPSIDSFQECPPLGEQDLIQEMEKHQKQSGSYTAVVKEFLRPTKDEDEEDSCDDDYFNQIMEEKKKFNSSYRKKQNKNINDSNIISNGKSEESEASSAAGPAGDSMDCSPVVSSLPAPKLIDNSNHNNTIDEDTNNNKND